MSIINQNKFPVSEIFESIQGEGNYAGVNCLFIRFQLCNLTCTWCDTKYTWTRFSDKFQTLELSELKKKITESKQVHIIFTGGEPALYLLDQLAVTGKKFHVETNGTIIPTQELKFKLKDGSIIDRKAMDEDIIRSFNWVVSPKLSNSRQEINAEALHYWANQDFAVFKFILDNEEDLAEIKEVIETFNIPKNKVYIGLQGSSKESQLNTKKVNTIIESGFHFSPRLHVLYWGNERGK